MKKSCCSGWGPSVISKAEKTSLSGRTERRDPSDDIYYIYLLLIYNRYRVISGGGGVGGGKSPR